MKFDYHKFPLVEKDDFFGSSILKPIIPVGVLYGNNSLRYGVLIDSGADFSIFDGEIGDALGIDVRSGVRHVFGGIQNVKESEAFRHTVTIEVGGLKYETEVSFSYDIAPHGHGILGQKGFFNLFVVCFDYLRETIELKERRK